MLSRSQLLDAAKAFCGAKDLDTLLSCFSSTSPITVIEHGDTALTEFNGRFEGLDSIRSYLVKAFTALQFEQMKILEFTVDTEERRVICQGHVTLTWRETGQSLDENFIYMFDFDEEGKVTKQQIWPDTGSVHLASKGALSEVRAAASNTS